MSVYGQFYYGTALYGLAGLPVSPDFHVFDFCYPTDAVMTHLFAYPQVSAFRGLGSPHIYYNLDNDLCMMCDDLTNSGFRMDLPITNNFTLQFTIKSSALPEDFSSPTSNRFFVAAYNQYTKMIGVLLSENGGIALSRDGVTIDDVLPDSADLFGDGSTYYTFRLAVDADANRGHIYVTERDLVPSIGHQLQYSFPLQDTPAGYTDYILVDVLGTSVDPTAVCMDCIRLHNAVVMNHRPIAVPGDDQTRSEGQYAAFDGSGSYDPDPGDVIHHYWWTITEAPTGAEIVVEGSNDTAADASGYTNKLTGSAGDFSDITQGDLLMIGDYKSPVMYVSPDGSWVVAIDHVFPAGTTDTEWLCIKQEVWDGDWTPSSMHVVQSSETDPSTLTPTAGDSFLVLPGAVGLWLNKQHTIATWTGSGWSFTDPEDEDVLYDIAANVSYRYLYLPPAPPPHNGVWYAAEPKPWELGHWSGRTSSLGRMYAADRGLYIIELVVNDGELDSIPVEVLLNVFVTDVALGLTPDLSFVWDYISDFWDIVEDKEKIESFWSGFTQLLSGELLALWQHDYSKDILSIQRTFQRQWLNFDPLYDEPNYDELPAAINNSVDTSGYSSTPNVQVPDPTDPVTLIDSTTAYDLGALVSGITDANSLVLGGVCYQILRVEDGTTTVVITKEEITTGADRPKAWMIRPTVKSRFSDFTKLGVVAGDKAIFEIIDSDGDASELSGYVWGAREGVLAFDDESIAASIADPDVTVRFKSIFRRTNILVDDLVVSIPRLQEVIALDRVEGAPDPLHEAKDFQILTTTTLLNQDVTWIEFLEAWFERKDFGFDGEYSASNRFSSASADFTSSLGAVDTDLTGFILVTPDGRFRLKKVISSTELELYDASLESGLTDKDWQIREMIDPPDSLWAEITFLDNRPTIEDNFGRLIGFTLDDLEERTDNLDYLSAVQGLWYATWFGRTLENIRIGAQILLGLPFAEVDGTITDIKSPYDSVRDRVILQDVSDGATVRAYYYPTEVGIADNRDTGVPLQVGDVVDQFDPLSKGVQVDDWESIPNWANPYIGSGDMHEVQKIHTFLVKVSSDVFDLTNLTFLISFLLRIKPRYVYPIFAVVKQLIDNVDVGDSTVFGPAIPVSGSYPSTWPTFEPTLGWSEPGPNEENAVAAINRVAPPIFDITTRWPNDRFVTPRMWEPDNPFGNLHLQDSPGRTPDGWVGDWNGLPDHHDATRDEGPRRYDATDESGHYIHKYDPQLTWKQLSGTNGGFIRFVGGEGGFTYLGHFFAETGAGFTPDVVGEYITISGGPDPTDNGTFLITNYYNPDNIMYWNPAGVTPSVVSGITWEISGGVQTYIDDYLAARDGHMEDALTTYWPQIGSPSTFVKVGSPVKTGTKSLHVVCAADEGAYNEFGASASDDTPTIHTVPADPASPDGGAPGFQVAVTGWIRIVSGLVTMRLRDQDGTTYIAEVRRNQPNHTWLRFVLHHWHFHGSSSPLRFEVVAGAGGAEFYLDGVEAFIKAVPWSQVGYDRSIGGRTGGYTVGGDPDEFFQVRMHILVP